MKPNSDTIARRRANHHAALLVLAGTGPKAPRDGLKLWRALRKIEVRANAAACAPRNGEPVQGQPFRNAEEWEAFHASVESDVARAFGGKLPEGFVFNTDPRGYALKIRGPEAGRPGAFIPEGMETDWGGNGILAPVIE